MVMVIMTYQKNSEDVYCQDLTNKCRIRELIEDDGQDQILSFRGRLESLKYFQNSHVCAKTEERDFKLV